MRVLGIDVSEDLLARWSQLLAPEWQLFFVDHPDEWPAPVPPATVTLTHELGDTYTVWRLRRDAPVVWFDEPSFLALPRSQRARLVRSQAEVGRGAVPTVRRWRTKLDAMALRQQADGHRFVWWPSLVGPHAEVVLADHVQDGQPASRHGDVAAGTWRRCERALPGARALAGTFANSGTANCFATTLAAAGDDPGDDQVSRERFEGFLASRCGRGGDDGEPGTVLVWRDRSGQVCHSAVTIGDGWALEKPAQTWWTPRVVLGVRELVGVNRAVGLRLERHRLLG